MKLFLDTNVLLDHALIRETGQPYEAKYILSWALESEIPMLVSSGSFYTFTYVLQKYGLRNDALKGKLNLYLQILQVCQTSKQCFLDALSSPFKDIEDSFQYYTAIKEECDYLLTLNTKDFKFSKTNKINVITPHSFLTEVLKKKKDIDF